jgi:hypothetical protein
MKARVFPRWQATLVAGLLVLTTGRAQEESPLSEQLATDAAPTSERALSSRRSSRMDRLRWNMKTLTDVYLSSGHRDAKWDNTATNALTLFARADSLRTQEGSISQEEYPTTQKQMNRKCLSMR